MTLRPAQVHRPGRGAVDTAVHPAQHRAHARLRHVRGRSHRRQLSVDRAEGRGDRADRFRPAAPSASPVRNRSRPPSRHSAHDVPGGARGAGNRSRPSAAVASTRNVVFSSSAINRNSRIYQGYASSARTASRRMRATRWRFESMAPASHVGAAPGNDPLPAADSHGMLRANGNHLGQSRLGWRATDLRRSPRGPDLWGARALGSSIQTPKKPGNKKEVLMVS